MDQQVEADLDMFAEEGADSRPLLMVLEHLDLQDRYMVHLGQDHSQALAVGVPLVPVHHSALSCFSKDHHAL